MPDRRVTTGELDELSAVAAYFGPALVWARRNRHLPGVYHCRTNLSEAEYVRVRVQNGNWVTLT